MRTPFATLVIAGKRVERDGEGEEAFGGAIGTVKITTSLILNLSHQN